VTYLVLIEGQGFARSVMGPIVCVLLFVLCIARYWQALEPSIAITVFFTIGSYIPVGKGCGPECPDVKWFAAVLVAHIMM
jgi:hypothetical protein